MLPSNSEASLQGGGWGYLTSLVLKKFWLYFVGFLSMFALFVWDGTPGVFLKRVSEGQPSRHPFSKQSVTSYDLQARTNKPMTERGTSPTRQCLADTIPKC